MARSLKEAGKQLRSFYECSRSMWRALRSTNALENPHREFRGRTKTQASFASEEEAVSLLYGLVPLGEVQLRKIDGHRRPAAFLGKEASTRAA